MNRYLMPRSNRPAALGVVLTCGLGLLCGCDAINPRLIGTLGGNTTETMQDAEGYIGIVLMNTTTVVSQVNMTLTNKNGSFYDFYGVMLPYDSKSKTDHMVAVLECDLESVQLTSLIYDSGQGEAVEVQFDYGPFVNGQNMFCGDVIYITVAGSPPNITASIGVY